MARESRVGLHDYIHDNSDTLWALGGSSMQAKEAQITRQRAEGNSRDCARDKAELPRLLIVHPCSASSVIRTFSAVGNDKTFIPHSSPTP